MKRHPFNLVEIALATAVLGVGVASVLALFPVGAATSRSSVAENTIADVAEFFFSYFQNQYQKGWSANGTRSDFATDEKCPSFAATPSDDDVPKGNSGFSAVPNIPGLLVHSTNPQYYLYRQGDEDHGIDFEAMVRVGRVAGNVNTLRYPLLALTPSSTATDVLSNSGNAKNADRRTLTEKCLVSLVLEFSWPIDAPWSEREKRLYRLDFFNEKFTPNTLP